VNTWYQTMLQESEEDNEILSSLLRVRGLHLAAAQASTKRLAEKESLIATALYESTKLDEDMWAAFKMDLENSNIPATSRKWPLDYTAREGTYLPVRQFQQAMTQYALIGFEVLFPKRLFILGAEEEDLYAYKHLWAVLGYALGMDDQYNIAL